MKAFLTVLVMSAATMALGAGGNAFTNRSGIFSVHEYEADYILLLSSSVFAGYKDTMPVSYAEIPAFGPERGFWLSPDDDGHLIVWSEATTNLWSWAGFGAPDENKPRRLGRSRKELLDLAAKEGVVRFYERRISRELGARVSHCWQRVLFEERPPAESQGLDGVTVVFGASDEHSNTAFWKVWCPPNGSKAALLTKLAHAMRKLVVDRSDVDLLAVLEELETQVAITTSTKGNSEEGQPR